MDELGGGRYRLGDEVALRPTGGLSRAVDGRLGRTVLVQYDDDTAFSEDFTRLLGREHPGVARVLDGGEDVRADGTRRAYVVYPDSTWAPAASVPSGQWIAAACTAVRKATGAIVAPCISDVLVDIHPVPVSSSRVSWRVQWLPSPAGIAQITARSAPVGTVPTSHRKEVA